MVLSVSLLGITNVRGYVWFAFAGASLAAGMFHLMARRSAEAGPARLALAGVALGASLHAMTGTITMYDTSAFDSYRLWVVGSFEDRDAVVLLWLWPFLAVGLILALASGLTLNALALGGYFLVGSTEQIFDYKKMGFEMAGPFLYTRK